MKYRHCNFLLIFIRFVHQRAWLHLSLAVGNFQCRCFRVVKGVCTQKDGDVHDKFNFLEIQELRLLKTCQKHFETIFPNFLLDECGI